MPIKMPMGSTRWARPHELPVFEQRHVYIAGLEAEEAAASRQARALTVDARSKAGEGLLALEAVRRAAHYFRDTLVPLRDKIVEQSQLHYHGMLLGLYQLIALSVHLRAPGEVGDVAHPIGTSESRTH